MVSLYKLTLKITLSFVIFNFFKWTLENTLLLVSQITAIFIIVDLGSKKYVIFLGYLIGSLELWHQSVKKYDATFHLTDHVYDPLRAS